MIPVTVRDARPADAAAIERVARASWTETYRDIFEPAYIEEFLTANYDVARLARGAAEAERRGQVFLVAEREGEIVGYLQFGDGERGPELWRIYADPAQYGSGVGSALLAELHVRIDGRVDSYVLDVHPDNARGRAFYDRNGFVIAGEGATPDCHLMLRRTLRPVRATLPIETERLRLRELTDADAVALHAIYGDPETMVFVGRTGRPTRDLDATRASLAFLRRHDELHGFSLWAADELQGEPLVAIAGLLWVEGHGPEVEAAYFVRRDRWKRGYATEALRAVLDAGHRDLGLARIVALAYPENEVSRRVMEKAGMRANGSVQAYGRTLTRHISGA